MISVSRFITAVYVLLLIALLALYFAGSYKDDKKAHKQSKILISSTIILTIIYLVLINFFAMIYGVTYVIF